MLTPRAAGKKYPELIKPIVQVYIFNAVRRVIDR